MPYRSTSTRPWRWTSSYRRRSSYAASRIQRAFRARRKRKYRPRKTKGKVTRKEINRLTKSVRTLFKRDDKKFYYTHVNNVLITGGPSLNQAFQGIFDVSQIPFEGSTDPNTGVAYPGYQTREKDSAMCNLRNIRIHMTLHATHNEAYPTQKCYVALVKTRVGVGSNLGITVPLMTDIWDYGGAGAGNLLAPWELFRNTQAEGAELLNDETFKILKQWTIYLQPQHGQTALSARTQVTTAVPPGTDNGTIISVPPVPAPGAPVNFSYSKTRPSEVVIKYTHKALNAKLQFISTVSSTPTNVKYFLVMCGNGTDITRGFRANVSVKTNFIDE